MRSLSEGGVAAIGLGGTSTARDWAEGENIVINYGAFIRDDGRFGALADVAFLHDEIVSPIGGELVI